MQHTGMHIGGGKIIHCSGEVCTGNLSKKSWTHFGIPVGLYDGSVIPDVPVIPVPKPTLKKGSKGEAVKEMQAILISKGYDLGKWGADGDFGKQTLAAVKSFQKAEGLKVDGIVGPLTWAKLCPNEKG
ncbi:MAG: peptidoglycan-binding protein [Clostridia bacterium]|nr:peptidoglycan-binding protein [Clostridia bacterium]